MKRPCCPTQWTIVDIGERMGLNPVCATQSPSNGLVPQIGLTPTLTPTRMDMNEQ